MKKLLYIMLFSFVLFSCEKDDEILPIPSGISNLDVESIVGGAVLNWEVPADSAYTYLEIRYLKNEKQVIEKASKYANEFTIDGLIAAEEFNFEVQSVNETPSSRSEGEIFTIGPVKPEPRASEFTYHKDQLTAINVTADMLDTFTQESTEGPKVNLVDGDPNTYWHTAWSSDVAPLPHWIQINLDEPIDFGAITYWFRNSADASGRPTKWALDTSDDGESWNRVWESETQASSPVDQEHKLAFDKNYTSQYFRVVILENESRTATFTHLGEIAFFEMASSIVNLEQEAEEEYYNF